MDQPILHSMWLLTRMAAAVLEAHQTHQRVPETA